MEALPMKWSVAQAKQRLSELLRSVDKEPQTIFNRSRPVAVVVGPDTFARFKTWQSEREARTVAKAFDELRSLAASSGYVLRLPERKDRKSDWGALE
jgi:prevent-host-death family protein